MLTEKIPKTTRNEEEDQEGKKLLPPFRRHVARRGLREYGKSRLSLCASENRFRTTCKEPVRCFRCYPMDLRILSKSDLHNN
ncbi:hypothetical protein KIN20_001923 [Parelaphostrongylus tenuis]|uniref:Uncharacterized protein n=1 Tax=Parelaphostrongylus tenuis TaxID=148309 RepID=A0AAD5QEZ6_PARTN|nr:hypothetical protein KIN20_001923 [Parelaphostrongylus tenuis]